MCIRTKCASKNWKIWGIRGILLLLVRGIISHRIDIFFVLFANFKLKKSKLFNHLTGSFLFACHFLLIYFEMFLHFLLSVKD
jgi:hypothetical protein